MFDSIQLLTADYITHRLAAAIKEGRKEGDKEYPRSCEKEKRRISKRSKQNAMKFHF